MCGWLFWPGCLLHHLQAYALLLVEEEVRSSKEAEIAGRVEQLDLLCHKNAYLQEKVSRGAGLGEALLTCDTGAWVEG